METKTRKIGIKDLPAYKTSPFHELLYTHADIVALRGKTKESKDFADIEDGDIKTFNVHNGKNYYYWKDKERFCKVYHAGVKEIAALRKPATNLFWCITQEATPNKDMVMIDCETFQMFSGINSKTSYYEAITDLVTANMIAIAKVPIFYINPIYFFNGDRTLLMRSAEDRYNEIIKLNKGAIPPKST